MSANAALITMETFMYNKGKQFENQFFTYEPKCKINVYILGLFRGAQRGSSIIGLGLSGFQLSSHPLSMYISNKETI